jgi:NADH:ubiquinone oxidoreductase subunit 5 (subunit L)/multisubunit Na+/H+ antiporter MnhA subunit
MLAQKLAIPYNVLLKKYKFDEFYLWLIDKVYYPVSNFMAKTDYDFLDQKIVDGVGRTGGLFSWMSGLFDNRFVDRIMVDGGGDISQWLGKVVRRFQSGLAQSYLFWMIVGLGSMLAWIAHHFK